MKINKIVDKAYCINLERRSDRWLKVKNEFELNDIDVYRFEALDGQQFDKYPTLKRGAAACLESHLSILKDAFDKNYEAVAIFEDDVFFVTDFEQKFETFYKQVPPDWQILYLANNKDHAKIEKISENVEKVSRARSAHAFIIKKQAIKEAIKLISPGEKQVDAYYGILQQSFPSFCAVPSLAGQTPNYSDIENGFRDYNFIYKL